MSQDNPTIDIMPEFTLKAQDRYALHAIDAYRTRLREVGLTDQAAEVDKAHREMELWQDRHPERVKEPDHVHQPAHPFKSRWQAIDAHTGKPFDANSLIPGADE